MELRNLPPMAALRAFAALAQSGSMTRAGAALNVSHAAISQHVRGLEDHIGVKLIARDGRRVALTPQGADLAEAVTAGFQRIGEAVERLSGADAARPLQITTTPMFAASWLMPRIGSFRRRHPDIDLMLNPTPDVVDLRLGGIDAAVRYGSGNWPGLEAELLVQSDSVIVAARNLLGDRKIRAPADLLDFPWLQELGTDEALTWLRAQGVTQGRVASMIHLPGNLLIDGLRRGDGVAATARAFIEEDIRDGRLDVLFDRNPGAEGYYLVTRPGVARPALRGFQRWIRDEVAHGGPRAFS